MEVRLAKNESFVLHCVLQDSELLDSISEDDIYFISEISNTIFKSLVTLSKNNVSLADNHIIAECNDESINLDLLTSIRNIEDIKKENFKFYYQSLKEEYAKSQYSNHILKNTVVELSKKGSFDKESLRDYIKKGEECLSLMENNESKLMTGVDLVDMYQEDVTKRLLTNNFESSGCSHLDSIIGGAGFAPGEQTLIFARSSMGKSAFKLNLVNRMIYKRIPNISIELEMTAISTMDRLICMRNGINLEMLYPKGDYDDSNLSDYITELLKRERKKFEKVNTFMFIDESDLDINSWSSYIKDAKRIMGVDKINVFTDLLTMLKEFHGDNKASRSEDAMNRLHDKSKELNAHLINVVQASREEKNMSIKTVEDLQKFRLGISDIKNAGAFYERHRRVYSLLRPMFYASQYFEGKPELDVLEDDLILQTLKNSHSDVGRSLKYLFMGSNFRIVKKLEDEEEE